MQRDTLEELERLGALLEKGLITREEFDSEKQRLLGSPLPAAPPPPGCLSGNYPTCAPHALLPGSRVV